MRRFILLFFVFTFGIFAQGEVYATENIEDIGWDFSDGWFDRNPGKFKAAAAIYDNDLTTGVTIAKGSFTTIQFYETLDKGIMGFYGKCGGLYFNVKFYNGNTVVKEFRSEKDVCKEYYSYIIDQPITKIEFRGSINSVAYIKEFDIFTEIDPIEFIPVENLSVKKKTYESIELSWESSKKALGNRIYLDGKLIGTLDKGVDNYEIKNLNPNQKYQINVSSVYKTGESELKGIEVVTDDLPKLPSDFVVVTDISDNSAVFKFNLQKIEHLPSKLKIYKSIDSTNTMDIPVYSNVTLDKKIDGLKAETEYTYYVAADYGNNRITDKIPITFKTAEANREVSNLKATAAANSVVLKWNMPLYDDLQFARIYRKKDNSEFGAKLKALFVNDDGYSPLFETNGTNFKDLTVASDTAYTYKVTTVDNAENETLGITVKTKTPKMSVGGGGTNIDENGDYLITWESPVTGKIKVLIAGKEHAIVPAADKKIIIPKDKMKFDLLGIPDVQLIPIDDSGNEGIPSKPGGGGIGDIIGGGDTAAEITPENTLDMAVGLFLLVGGFLLLGMSFWLVPKLIRLIRQALGNKNSQTEIGRRTS